MPFVADFSGAEEAKDFSQPIPVGEYELVVTAAEFGTSQAGNPKVSLTLRVVEGEHAGRIIYDTLTFTPKAKHRVDQFHEAAGLDRLPAGAVEVDETAYIGLGLLARIKHEPGYPDTTKKRARVDRYLTAGKSAGGASDLPWAS